jgi:hypothetical protein
MNVGTIIDYYSLYSVMKVEYNVIRTCYAPKLVEGRTKWWKVRRIYITTWLSPNNIHSFQNSIPRTNQWLDKIVHPANPPRRPYRYTRKEYPVDKNKKNENEDKNNHPLSVRTFSSTVLVPVQTPIYSCNRVINK